VRVILLPGGEKAAYSFLLYRIRYMSPIYLNKIMSSGKKPSKDC